MKPVTEKNRPVLLTSRGRGVAVIQSVADYEKTVEERAFMRRVVKGVADLEAGEEVSQRFQLFPDPPDTGRITPEFNQPVLHEFIHPPFRVV